MEEVFPVKQLWLKSLLLHGEETFVYTSNWDLVRKSDESFTLGKKTSISYIVCHMLCIV